MNASMLNNNALNSDEENCIIATSREKPASHLSAVQADKQKTGNIDDAALIKRFAQGETEFASNNNLRIEYNNSQLQLFTRKSELIGLVTCLHKSRSALIKNSSLHKEIIHKSLTDHNFVFLGDSKRPGFIEYEQYATPDGYKVNHTEAGVLWKTWWPSKRHATNLNILVFNKGNWCYLQDIIVENGSLYIKTVAGEITLQRTDKLIWATKVSKEKNTGEILDTNGEISSEKILNTSSTQGKSEKVALPLTNDDENLIKVFAEGETKFVFSQNLQIESQLNVVTLRNRKRQLVAILKRSFKITSALVKNTYQHWEFIEKLFLENNFVPFGESKSQPGFFEYHQYEIPSNYKLNYTESLNLWKTWWVLQRRNNPHELALNIMVLTNERWYPIRDIRTHEKKLIFKTLVNEITLEATDKIAWIDKLNSPISQVANAKIPSANENLPAETSISSGEKDNKNQIPNPLKSESSQDKDELLQQLRQMEASIKQMNKFYQNQMSALQHQYAEDFNKLWQPVLSMREKIEQMEQRRDR